MVQLDFPKKRRFRYAAGYVIENEGTEVVERLIRDGIKSRFGVREEWAPSESLENLTRDEAEEILQDREWTFYGYQKIEDLTIPAKIFDTHIVFDFETAITFVQEALDVEETQLLDFETRKKIEEVQSQDFFSDYVSKLEEYVKLEYDNRNSLLRRVQKLPYRNVNASPTYQ
jgi:lysozyme family protein